MTHPSIILRSWRDNDLEPFTAMNADAEVMRFYPKPLNEEESREALQRMRTALDQRGWGMWAVEVDGVFAGCTGLVEPKFTAHFTPCIEIGWRFHREYWGRSIAYAAALAVQSFAFENLKLPELLSWTAVINTRSQRLMQRLGFARNAQDDFLHPSLPPESVLRPHVLYRKRAGAFQPASGVDIPGAMFDRGSMETLDVPEIRQLPELTTNEESPTDFADMVLTSLFGYRSALLCAEYIPNDESISWRIEPREEANRTHELEVAISPSLGSFRSVLARFGHHYLDGQPYGGQVLRFLRQRGRVHRCHICMSNNGQSGFWIRVYAAVV